MARTTSTVPAIVGATALVFAAAYSPSTSTAAAADPATKPANPVSASPDGDLPRDAWYATWERYLKAEPNSPEQATLSAELREISAARRGEPIAEGGDARPGDDPRTAPDLPPGNPMPLANLPGLSGSAVAFDPAGGRLLVAGGREARVWDARTLRPTTPVLRHEAGVRSASLSPDGTRVLTAGGPDAKVWDAATGKLLIALPHPAEVRSAAFAPDGRRLATGAADGQVRLWRADTGKPIDLPPMRHARPVTFVAFAGDAVCLSVDLWDRHAERTGKLRRAADVEPPAIQAWATDTGAGVWSWQNKRKWYQAWEDAAISSDGRALVVTESLGRNCEVLDATTGRSVGRFSTRDGTEFGRPAFSPDAARVAIAGWGGATIWDVAAARPAVGPIDSGHQDRVRHQSFSPDGRRLLVCAESGRSGIPSQLSGIYDVATGRKMLAFGRGDVVAGAFSPDGKRVVVGYAGREDGADVWAVPTVVPPPPPAVKTVAGAVPDLVNTPDLDPVSHDLFSEFAKAKLPRDLPLPAATAFDADPRRRADYHDGYRLGLAAGLMDGGESPEVLDKWPAAFRKGLTAGLIEGDRICVLRDRAKFDQRWGFRRAETGGHEVAADSPPDERAVRDAFLPFAAAFERELRAAYPDAYTLTVVGVPRLYAQIYDDLSRDNTGVPAKVRQFKAVLDSQRPGNLDWLRVRPKGQDKPGPDTGDYAGQYSFTFDYDPAGGRWALKESDTSPHDDQWEYSHLQQTDTAGRAFRGKDSPAVRAIVLRAVEQAQAKK